METLSKAKKPIVRTIQCGQCFGCYNGYEG